MTRFAIAKALLFISAWTQKSIRLSKTALRGLENPAPVEGAHPRADEPKKRRAEWWS